MLAITHRVSRHMPSIILLFPFSSYIIQDFIYLTVIRSERKSRLFAWYIFVFRIFSLDYHMNIRKCGVVFTKFS